MNILILDTNVLLAEPKIYASLSLLPDLRAGAGKGESDQYLNKIVILKTVLNELDSLKSAEGDTGFQAREASRYLEQVIHASARTENGWQIFDDCILTLDEETPAQLPARKFPQVYDDEILACAQIYMKQCPDQAVWLVTLDRNMRITAESRNMQWINPADWVPFAQNTYMLPIATYGIAWSPEGTGVRLPVKLGESKEGWVQVWPYWGYPSGEFSTLHFRLFEAEYQGAQDHDHSSPVLILSSEGQIRYPSKMRDIPYRAVQALPNQTLYISHKNWVMAVSVSHLQTSIKRIPDYLKRNAAHDLRYGTSMMGRGDLFQTLKGLQITTEANKVLKAETNSSPIFEHLCLEVSVEESNDLLTQKVDEFEKSGKIFQTNMPQAKVLETKKQSKWLLIGAGLAILVVIGCSAIIGISILLSVLSSK